MAHDPRKGFAVRDVIAWDASMVVEEARFSLTLNWLSEKEVWGLLFINARRVQEIFESWKDFTDASVRRREYEILFHKGHSASPGFATQIEKK